MNSAVFATFPLTVALLAAGPAAQAQHKAHTHGEAEASIIYDGSIVVLEMESPADNILGFEHAPKTAVQRSAHTRATKLLAVPGDLFSLPSSCSLVEQSVTSPFAGHDDHDDHHDEHDDHHGSHGEGHHDDHVGHADFSLAYQWQCGSLKSLAIDFGLFKTFPNFEKIRVQWIGFGKQSSAVVTIDNPVLVLE